MSRSLFALGGVVLSAALATTVACKRGDLEPASPSNVVLISIDTLRADRLNCYGYEARAVSPEIDRLAADGILFKSHISASPWTTPAHLSLFTALSPSSHGVMGAISQVWGKLKKGERSERLAEEHVTLAEVLSDRGYSAAAFTGGMTMDPRIGFDQGFDSYDTSQAKLDDESLIPATEWIEAQGEGPFFLFWHTFEVHAPYLKTDFLREVLPENRARRVEAALQGLRGRPRTPLEVKRGRKRLMRVKAFTVEVCSALYDGGVLSADRAVGKLVAALKRTGVYDRTLIVVTSDHGERFGETTGAHGLGYRDGRFFNAHGMTLYEEIIRVPLILKLPGARPAGRRVADVSRTIDVMPTVLDVLGIPGSSAMQGASLRPLWESRGSEAREAFSEALNASFESKSLRSDRHKYVLLFDAHQVRGRGRFGVPESPDVVELYDLHSDPGEQHNLMADPTPEDSVLAQRFDAELRRLAQERTGESAKIELDEETLEKIKSLGYVE